MVPSAQVVLDADVYSADAIQRAAYRFLDRCETDIRRDGSQYRCTLTSRTSVLSSDELVGPFRDEVLDQVLRERIRNETAVVRNLILSLAFSQTGLVDDD